MTKPKKSLTPLEVVIDKAYVLYDFTSDLVARVPMLKKGFAATYNAIRPAGFPHLSPSEAARKLVSQRKKGKLTKIRGGHGPGKCKL